MCKIAVTGGNGKIGQVILQRLKEHGYQAINLARGRRENISDQYFRTNLLNPGNVYASLARSNVEGIIHMGTINNPRNHPGYLTYQSNVMSSYYILEACKNLNINTVCLASSINAIGYSFQKAPVEIQYLPMDEEHPATPRDPYGLGKRVIEITADGFGRLEGIPNTIATLRYPWVAKEEELREEITKTDRSLQALKQRSDKSGPLFTYIHIIDAAEVAIKAIEATFKGHQTFWAVASDTTAEITTKRLVKELFPGSKLLSDISGYKSLISNQKAKDLLNWTSQYSWRDL